MPVTSIAVPAIIAGGGAILNYFSTQQALEAQTKANEKAQGIADDTLEKQLAAQEKAYQQARTDLAPWREKGANGLDLLSTLLGANGEEEQANALNNFVNDPTYQTLIKQGTDSVLKASSATGNLRAGGTASAVATVAPSILNQQLQERIAGLTNLAQMGQGAASQTANAGINIAGQETAAQGQHGSTSAQLALQQGQTDSVNPLLNSLGFALGSFGNIGGGGFTDWLSGLNQPAGNAGSGAGGANPGAVTNPIDFTSLMRGR